MLGVGSTKAAAHAIQALGIRLHGFRWVGVARSPARVEADMRAPFGEGGQSMG